MITKRSKDSSDDKFLEGLLGGPLTLGAALEGRRFVSADKAAGFAKKLGHPIATFVQLAVQDQIRRAGLKLHVEIKAA